jgi:hypothetical protein
MKDNWNFQSIHVEELVRISSELIVGNTRNELDFERSDPWCLLRHLCKSLSGTPRGALRPTPDRRARMSEWGHGAVADRAEQRLPFRRPPGNGSRPAIGAAAGPIRLTARK